MKNDKRTPAQQDISQAEAVAKYVYDSAAARKATTALTDPWGDVFAFIAREVK